MLRAIESDNFPPFGKFRLTLPPVEQKPDNLAEVHLFTGVNGTGKTRVLSILAAMLGNDEPLLKRVKGIENLFFINASGILPVPGKQLQALCSFWVQESKTGWEQDSAPLNAWVDGPAFTYIGIAYIFLILQLLQWLTHRNHLESSVFRSLEPRHRLNRCCKPLQT